jgi:flagellin
MRELAVQAANGSNSASDTSLLNQEFSQLQTEVARIQGSTTFNNVNVFTATDTIFQIGANTSANDRVNMQGTALASTMSLGTQSITDTTAASAFADISSAIATAGSASGATISSVRDAAIDAILGSQKVSFANENELTNAVNLAASAASGSVSTFTTNLNNILSINGSGANNVLGKVTTFGSSSAYTGVGSATAINNLEVAKAAAVAGNASGATLSSVYTAVVNAVNVSGTFSAAEKTATLTSLSSAYTAAQAGGGMTAAAFGNNLWTGYGGFAGTGVIAATTMGGGQAAISTAALEGLTPATGTNYATAFTATAGSLLATNTAVSGQTNAQSAINAIDIALTEVNTASATQGALQNRFSAVISNLTAFSQSQTAAKSRIVDADFAAETAKLSKNQILQQAGTAMLAQANQLPSSVLSLLK